MAIALRPRLSPSSISLRYGSQALIDRVLLGCVLVASAEPTGSPESVVTPLAGFAESPSGIASLAAFGGPESVVTSLAGFAGPRRPQPLGGRTPIPAAFR